MAFYINPDGKTVHSYVCTPEGIRIDSGEVITEHEASPYIFAMHPTDNPLMSRNEDGVWIYASSRTPGPMGRITPPRSMRRI